MGWLKGVLKRLWILVLVVAVLRVATAIVSAKEGIFADFPSDLGYVKTISLLDWAWSFCVGLLITLAVQHGRPPSDGSHTREQFSRLLSKLSFVIVAIFVPMMISDAGLGLFQGRVLTEAASIALADGLFQFITLGLPVFLLACVTRNLTEALAAAFVVTLGDIAATILLGVPSFSPLAVGGMVWIVTALKAALIVIGILIIVPLASFGFLRAARVLLAIGVVLVLSLPFLPRESTFAIQQRLSAKPAAGEAIAIGFDSAEPRVKSEYPDNPRSPFLYLPLRVSGVPRYSILKTDWLEIRVTDLEGHLLYTHRPMALSYGSFFDSDQSDQDVLNVRTNSNALQAVHKRQLFGVPGDVYAKIKDQPVRIEANYAFTVLNSRPDGNHRRDGRIWESERIWHMCDEEQQGLRQSCRGILLSRYRRTGLHDIHNH